MKIDLKLYNINTDDIINSLDSENFAEFIEDIISCRLLDTGYLRDIIDKCEKEIRRIEESHQ